MRDRVPAEARALVTTVVVAAVERLPEVDDLAGPMRSSRWLSWERRAAAARVAGHSAFGTRRYS
jgi:hypothetical protein